MTTEFVYQLAEFEKITSTQSIEKETTLRQIATKLHEGVHPITYGGMLCLMTGSRVYGYPRDDSDVDIVVLCSEAEFRILRIGTDNSAGLRGVMEVEYSNEDVSCSLHFGKLNLIVTWDVGFFKTWEEGTKNLLRIAPVTREQAVAEFDRLRERDGYGLRNADRWADS